MFVPQQACIPGLLFPGNYRNQARFEYTMPSSRHTAIPVANPEEINKTEYFSFFKIAPCGFEIVFEHNVNYYFVCT